MENSIRKRLSLQNEVVNWLNKFSDNLEKRANEVTSEVHELLDKTSSVEQDLKNARNSFRILCTTQFVENKVSEEDGVFGRVREDDKRPEDVSLAAQRYEEDILPRYKEAIAFGLNSYRNHMQKRSGSSVLRTGLASGPLPHIIGSEEYIHDNSCGLSDGMVLEGASTDFRHIVESKRASNEAVNFGSYTLFGGDVLEEQQEPPRKGAEPQVSAAVDFKAMLEAALLSSYKFYDEGSSSFPETVHGYNNPTEERLLDAHHAATTVQETVEVVTSQHLTSLADTTVPQIPGILDSFQSSNVEKRYISDDLISESLFDNEEESPPSSIHKFPDVLSRHSYGETSVVIQEKGAMHDSPSEEDDRMRTKTAEFPHTSSSASLSSSDGGSAVEATAFNFSSGGLASHYSGEGKSAYTYPMSSQDEDVFEGQSQLFDNLQSHLHTDSLARKVSLGPSTKENSPSLPESENSLSCISWKSSSEESASESRRTLRNMFLISSGA